MTAQPATVDTSDDQPAERLALAGTNINEQTYLATDYLNHFNEIVMLLELLPSMPEMLDDAKQWAPKSYPDHFRDSSFKDKELAIHAYDVAPRRARLFFDQTVDRMNEIVLGGLARAEELIASGDMAALEASIETMSRSVQRLIDLCSGIIHGNVTTMNQDQIDTTMNQDQIDDLLA
jgi:hypothetical protein